MSSKNLIHRSLCMSKSCQKEGEVKKTKKTTKQKKNQKQKKITEHKHRTHYNKLSTIY